MRPRRQLPLDRRALRPAHTPPPIPPQAPRAGQGRVHRATTGAGSTGSLRSTSLLLLPCCPGGPSARATQKPAGPGGGASCPCDPTHPPAKQRAERGAGRVLSSPNQAVPSHPCFSVALTCCPTEGSNTPQLKDKALHLGGLLPNLPLLLQPLWGDRPAAQRVAVGGDSGNMRGPQGVTTSCQRGPRCGGGGKPRQPPPRHPGPARGLPRGPPPRAAAPPALPLTETRPSVRASTAWAQGTCPREPAPQPQRPHSRGPQACVRGAGGDGGRVGHLVRLTLLPLAPTGVPQLGGKARVGFSKPKGQC